MSVEGDGYSCNSGLGPATLTDSKNDYVANFMLKYNRVTCLLIVIFFLSQFLSGEYFTGNWELSLSTSFKNILNAVYRIFKIYFWNTYLNCRKSIIIKVVVGHQFLMSIHCM